jgi:hypothetical protein
MIRAQLTLPDGRTPGEMRRGAAVIEACIARGCRIVPNPLNSIPPEWERYVVGQKEERPPVMVDAPQATPQATHQAEPKRKRGRPKKTA